MPNNLLDIIQQSGYTNKEIAEKRGVTPETLSRHMHGHINMSIQDIEAYAEILKVTPQSILFNEAPIPIIGECYVDSDGLTHRNFSSKCKQAVYMDIILLKDLSALIAVSWSCADDYRGDWYEWNGALAFFLNEPIVKNTIHTGCIQKACLVKVKKPIKVKGIETPQDILTGVLYPEPDDLYTLHAPKQNLTFQNLDLSWASPLTSVIFRPELEGYRIVDL